MLNVKKIPCEKFYNDVASLYSWRQVAERTERVYDYAASKRVPSMMVRIKTSLLWGSMCGFYALLYTILEAITLFMCDICLPADDIDVMPFFNTPVYKEQPLKYGDHKFSTQCLNERVNEQIVKDMYNKEDS